MMMMVVSVPAWHLEDRDVECIVVLFFELQNVLTSFHVESRDICVSGTIRRALYNLLGLCMTVIFVTILVVAVIIVAVIVVVILMFTAMLFVSKRGAFEWAIDK